MRRDQGTAVILSILLLFGLPPLSASSDEISNEASPRGFSREGLERLQGVLDTAVGEGRVPSAIAMIGRDGEIAWLTTAGEMGPGVPMRRDAILPLASVGKIYTATAVMILIERGQLSLEDPISKYLPGFADARVEVADEAGETRLVELERPLTLRHMLTHTGGIRSDGDAFWELRAAHVGKTSSRAFAEALARLPLQSQPGQRFSYGVTGSSYVVLAGIIEIVSGQSLEQFMFENIFEPLELHDTFFYLPREKKSQLPAFYRGTDEGLALERAMGEDFPRSTYFGSGGVMSSPRDILRFATIFVNGGESGGVRILRGETVAQMMRDHLGELASFQDPTMSWGFGAAVRMANRGTDEARMQQYGWAGGNYAILWVDPARRLVGYFAFPLQPPGDIGLLMQYQQMVYGALTE
jgi:CubicO group peptidase (beta-lactamase class C family)